MITAVDCVALFFDHIVVGSQHDRDGGEPTNFQVDGCNGSHGAATNNQDRLFRFSHGDVEESSVFSHSMYSEPGYMAEVR